MPLWDMIPKAESYVRIHNHFTRTFSTRFAIATYRVCVYVYKYKEILKNFKKI